MRVFINPQIMDLIPAYLIRRGEDLKRLQQFIEIEDFKSIEGLGHKLGGSGGTFGFAAISKVGTDLEAAALGRNISKIREHVQELSEYLANVHVCREGEI